MNVLIKGAAILGGEPTNVVVTDGVISAIGTTSAAPGATVIEADGLVLLPGLVDLHTHLREPGREDAETVFTGTQAAALGGYTAVHAMANTDPVADTAGVVEQVWRLGHRGPASATSTPSGRSPSVFAGNASPSSARWPTAPPACGCSPMTDTASPIRC